ncbi:MAG: FAD-dependent monooxygenase [Pseudomonadales bacterium]
MGDVGWNAAISGVEPRGLAAGYHWPQYSVHRGRLQMLLFDAVMKRMGGDALRLGHRVTGYSNGGDHVTVHVESADGERMGIDGALLVAADGLHSRVRAQMYPAQPPVHWGGAIMWRGATLAKPVRTGASFVGLGLHDHRLVFYPISQPDPVTGLALINWIAEITVDNSAGWGNGDWNRKVEAADVLPHFAHWRYDWLDVPALLRGAPDIFEFPMIDRDPVPTWRDGRVALLGDAAHVMYPVGSSGASQAIVDARVLGAGIVRHGVSADALRYYDETLCDRVSALVLRNRGSGPFAMLATVEARCGGVFDHIDEVVPPAEMADFMAAYKAAAGFAIETLNQAPPTIPPGAKVQL